VINTGKQGLTAENTLSACCNRLAVFRVLFTAKDDDANVDDDTGPGTDW